MSLVHTRIGPFDVYQLPNGKIHSVIIHKTKENLQLKTYQILYALGPQLRYPIHKKIRYVSEQVFDETANAYQANRYGFGSAFVDHFFNSFSIMWRNLRDLRFFKYATAPWILACDLVTDWENRNRPIKIHKGTPFYFLGRTYIENGELDLGFNFIYSAIAEDERLSRNTGNPGSYVKAPAFMYATLDDDRHNLMYDYVLQLRRLIEEYLHNYGSVISTSTLDMSEIDRKFLKNNSQKNAVFWFVYLLQYLEKRRRMKRSLPKLDVYKNDFAKFNNLDMIFSLCLVIDEVLRSRFNQEYFGGNIAALARPKNWLSAGIRLRTLTDSLGITRGRRTLNPDAWLPNGLRLSWTFSGQRLDPGLQFLLIALGLRNYGGHNLAGQQILSDEFDKIVEKLVFALFLGIEELP